MKIAIATTNKEADAPIPALLAEAKYLFIAEMEKFAVIKIYTAEQKDCDMAFAKQTVQEDCEAIICGQIEKPAFDILAGSCVTRFNGEGLSATEALKLMNAGALPLIPDHIAGPGCPGQNSGGECHEHDK